MVKLKKRQIMNMYIFLVECPISGNIVHINKAIKPKFSSEIKSNPNFQKWEGKIKKRKLKPLFTIIDNEPSNKTVLIDYYRWIFKTWNIELFEHSLFEQRDIHKINHLKALSSQIYSSKKDLELKHKAVNYNLILYFLWDLNSISGISRIIDELLLACILTFIMGVRYDRLQYTSIMGLEFQKNKFEEEYGLQYMAHLISYLDDFRARYDRYHTNEIPFAFKELNLEIGSLNDALNKVSRYLGYNLNIEFDNYWRINHYFDLSYYRYHQQKLPKGLISAFEYELHKYIDKSFQDEHVIGNHLDARNYVVFLQSKNYQASSFINHKT